MFPLKLVPLRLHRYPQRLTADTPLGRDSPPPVSSPPAPGEWLPARASRGFSVEQTLQGSPRQRARLRRDRLVSRLRRELRAGVRYLSVAGRRRQLRAVSGISLLLGKIHGTGRAQVVCRGPVAERIRHKRMAARSRGLLLLNADPVNASR